jgi:Na+/H+-translocating membrane pyrophosphatase
MKDLHLPSEAEAALRAVVLVAALGVLGLASAWILVRSVLLDAAPPPVLQRVAEAVGVGARALLARQTKGAAGASAVFGAATFALYAAVRMKDGGLGLGLSAALAFSAGAAASLAAGYAGSFVARRASARLAALLAAERAPRLRPEHGAPHPLNAALQLALRGGAAMGVAAVAISLLAMTLAFGGVVLAGDAPARLPIVVAGFAFGASLVSLLLHVGGGVFATAAGDAAEQAREDLGLRDPARVARAVGDHARDWTALAADLLETAAVETAAAVFLAFAMHPPGGEAATFGFLVFPLAARAFGILAAVVGVMSVTTDGREDVGQAIERGLFVTALLAALGLGGAAYWLLGSYWAAFFGCALVGVAAQMALARLARAAGPSRVAQVRGLAGALSAAWKPAGVLVAAMVASYELGEHSGIAHAGPYGAVLAATGMLATSGYVMAMNGLASIADGAGAVLELAPDLAPRDANTDKARIDAASTVARAVARAYLVGAGALASFALVMAYAAEVPHDVPVLASPAALVGALAGVLVVVTFSALSGNAVTATAKRFADEARRRIASLPAAGELRPSSYRRPIDVLAHDALKRTTRHAAAVVGLPIAIGILFKEALGSGAEAVGALLSTATVAGMVLALVAENDEAARRMGPAIAPPVKLLGTVSLILAPLFL